MCFPDLSPTITFSCLKLYNCRDLFLHQVPKTFKSESEMASILTLFPWNITFHIYHLQHINRPFSFDGQLSSFFYCIGIFYYNIFIQQISFWFHTQWRFQSIPFIELLLEYFLNWFHFLAVHFYLKCPWSFLFSTTSCLSEAL